LTDRAGEGAHGTDPPVIGIAREIIPSRPGGLRRRQQAHGATDDLTGKKIVSLADGDPYQQRPLGLGNALQTGDAQEDALALLPVFHRLDDAGHRRDDRMRQHRSRNAARAEDTGGEPGEDGG